MTGVGRDLKDVLAGGMFVVMGLGFALMSLTYDIGDSARLGPGGFPLFVGILLSGIGALVVVKAFVAEAGEPIGSVDWRALALVGAALLFFGLTVRGLGVGGALFGASFLGAYARAQTGWKEAVLIAAGLTVLTIVIFVVALRLRVPLFGNWLPI